MTPLFDANDTYVDGVDVVVCAAMVALCGVFFLEGGAVGYLGAIGGALLGWRRPLHPLRPWRSIFKAVTAGLWAGLLIGALFATALTR